MQHFDSLTCFELFLKLPYDPRTTKWKYFFFFFTKCKFIFLGHMILQELLHKPQAVSWYSDVSALPDRTTHDNTQNDKNWL